MADPQQVLADPQGGVDWTLNDDWSKENNLRWERNVLVREQLKRGESAIYRSSGNSMWPRVKSGDLCEFAPFPKTASVEKDINVGDIVFCEVQPRKLLYAHIVLEKIRRKLRRVVLHHRQQGQLEKRVGVHENDLRLLGVERAAATFAGTAAISHVLG